MKWYSLALSILFAVALIGCESTPTVDRPPLDPTNADAQVKVTGMSCPQCSHNIKVIMDRMEGIEQTRVDLGAGRVLIAFDEGKTVSKEEITLAVKDAGFTPGEVTYKKGSGQ